MSYAITTATRKVCRLTKRIRAIQGGTSASKTISILIFLIDRAQRKHRELELTSIVSESIPHLKRGAMRDFKNIMMEQGYWKDSLWNATDSIYTFETGNMIEFFSTDNADKLRGARRHWLFMNECNNLLFDAFEQLEVRTKKGIFLDWNPTNEFWFYTDVKPVRNDVDHIVLTYKDNEALDAEIIKSIEQRKNRNGWWRVYGLGELGEVEGKIYKDWLIIDEVPHEARLVRRGLDFGYTNDPSTITDVYRYNGGYILDETLYQKGLSNKQIFEAIANLNEPQMLVIADSAEPKSIDELKLYGLNIIGTEKGKDSVSHGIQMVQDCRISITRRSSNVIKEYRNYLWETDKNGKILNIPEHQFSHCFSPNSLVHTTKGQIPIQKLVDKQGYVYTRNGKIKRFYNVRPTRLNTETIKIEFNDGQILEVTPDHLLLKPNGEWIESQLLWAGDMIQSVNDTNIQWSKVLQIQKLKILQGLCEWKKKVASSLHLGNRERCNSFELSYSSQRREHGKQLCGQFGIETQVCSFERTYDTRKKEETKRMDKNNKSTHKEMAWIKRGEGMAQVTWEENIRTTRSCLKRLFSLPQDIYYNAICKVRKILSSELQNESKIKTIKGITRGFCPVTYNMEVEDTHCLLVDGVIAHNSMDGIRYAIVSLLKKPEDDINGYQQIEINRYERNEAVTKDLGL